MIGREHELKLLDQYYRKKEAQLVVVHGRRRVGKSFLLENWVAQKEHLFIEGLENQSTLKQIQILKRQIMSKINKPALASADFKNWSSILDLLSLYIEDNHSAAKKVIVLDEFQWLCVGRSELVSLIKLYWDQHWKKLNTDLILCGSIAHFMIQKVIKSKALYGRINLELKIKPFNFATATKMFKPQRSIAEMMEYYFVFGGIPKYLKEIESHLSFEKNLNRLCFVESGPMVQEFEKIFYQQFKSAKIYIQIIKLLSKHALTFGELSQKLAYSSGGSLKSYCDNLCEADFIATYHPFHKGSKAKDKKYFLSDEFCHFYLRFMEENKNLILENSNKNLISKILTKNQDSWNGISFERFCFKQAKLIASAAEFEEEVKDVGKFFPNANYKVQLDLVFLRFDSVISIFEIKYKKKIDTEIIKEFEQKIAIVRDHPFFKNRTLEKGLVYFGELDPSIEKAGYFHHLISVKDLINIKSH